MPQIGEDEREFVKCRCRCRSGVGVTKCRYEVMYVGYVGVDRILKILLRTCM